MLLRSGRFMVGDKQDMAKVSIKLEASLAPAQAEVEAGVVAKADQTLRFYIFTLNYKNVNKYIFDTENKKYDISAPVRLSGRFDHSFSS